MFTAPVPSQTSEAIPPTSSNSSPAPANSEVTSIGSGRITSRVSTAVVDRAQLVGVVGGVVGAVGRCRRSGGATGSSSWLWTLKPSTSSVAPGGSCRSRR